MEIRSAYSPRLRVAVKFKGLSRTKQAFRDECDINNIMKKHRTTGLITHVRTHGGNYDDVSQGVDYQSAMNTVIRAQDAFASLPAKVRSRFYNNPGDFLEFVSDPDNRDEMIKMGLMKPGVEVSVAVPVVVQTPAVVAGVDKPDK